MEKQTHKDWREEFDKEFDGVLETKFTPEDPRVPPITLFRSDDLKGFISSLLSSKQKELIEAISSKEFCMDVNEYLPLVERWSKRDYDTPFDDGYAKAKSDAQLLVKDILK